MKPFYQLLANKTFFKNVMLAYTLFIKNLNLIRLILLIKLTFGVLQK